MARYASMCAVKAERIGVVVHPTRDVDGALDALRDWAGEHGVDVVQVSVDGQKHEVAEQREASECDLVVAVGGDGTMLAAVRAAADADRPVLGVACGSLGVLTSVTAADVAGALDRWAAGDWTGTNACALEVERDDGETLLALNDVAVTRGGQGQVMTGAEVDGVLYARFAGDGFIVSTPVGSSAYTMAAGGPLLAPGAAAFVFTPLSSHGGFAPPLVVGDGSKLHLDIEPGYGGIRLELDGRPIDAEPASLDVTMRSDYATIVVFDDQEPLFAGLRRRKLLMDSPRVLARDKREGRAARS
jgi:NAD+ kinase